MIPNARFNHMLEATKYVRGYAGFCKTREKYGELSNMHTGFPLVVSGIKFRTSESLYQSLKFPYDPELQQTIIDADWGNGPIAAKREATDNETSARHDWFEMNFVVMYWVLSVKYWSHKRFADELHMTNPMPIVELLYKRGGLWGAKARKTEDVTVFEGANVLGKMLTRLREKNGGGKPPVPLNEFIMKAAKDYGFQNFTLLDKDPVYEP